MKNKVLKIPKATYDVINISIAPKSFGHEDDVNKTFHYSQHQLDRYLATGVDIAQIYLDATGDTLASKIEATDFKIWARARVDEEDWARLPDLLNYKSGLNKRLHPERTWAKGELKKVEFFGTAVPGPENSQTFSNAMTLTTFDYFRDLITGLIILQRRYRQWYMTDGSLSEPLKVDDKYYSPSEAMKEGGIRRDNVIEQMLPVIAGVWPSVSA